MTKTTRIKKPYRVTQYEQLSEAGLALCPASRSRNTPQKICSKDYRWKWTARIVAAMCRGTSAGLGLCTLTATLEDLRDESEAGKVGS